VRRPRCDEGNEKLSANFGEQVVINGSTEHRQSGIDCLTVLTKGLFCADFVVGRRPPPPNIPRRSTAFAGTSLSPPASGY